MLVLRRALLFSGCLVAAGSLLAQVYRTPAGGRTAVKRVGAQSILPGGRIIQPMGRQYPTGPGPFGLAVSPDGKRAVTADGGPNHYSLTVLDMRDRYWKTSTIDATKKAGEEREAKGTDDADWTSVFMGLAFRDDDTLYASEGNSGRVRVVDAGTGRTERLFHLNQGKYRDSYTGDLAYDQARKLLYVVDQANFRLAIVDTSTGKIASVGVGRLPFAVALSPDGKRAYVTNIGMFQYQALPGADPDRPAGTGIPFPAFGFPSKDAAEGVVRVRGDGSEVEVPGLGDPNVFESNSVAVVDVSNAAAPKVAKFIRTGLPFGRNSLGGSSPAGILAHGGHVFVSNAHNDSITVFSARTLEVEREIPLRVPGLESYRGVLPLGLAVEPDRNWLLVAEAGINAVGVINLENFQVVGHLPAGWFPTRVAVHGGSVIVAAAKGHGTGPNATLHSPLADSFQGDLRAGLLAVFPAPEPNQLPDYTRQVMEFNGFRPQSEAPAPLPAEVRYVVIIVKENRTFDEVFGDLPRAANGPVNAAEDLARLGERGLILRRTGLASRIQGRLFNISPNHHALARRFAFSDNFYADSEVSVDGHHWIVGSYPDEWTESSMMASYGGQKDFRLPTGAPGRLSFAQSDSSVHPEEQLEAGALWHHLERHHISFRNFGEGFELAGVVEGAGLEPTGARYLTNMPMPEPLYRNTSRNYPGFNMNVPDQYRATQFIHEIQEKYLKGGEPFPHLIFIHLPNDHMTRARPGDGYPVMFSYVADNDYALGRMVEFLSSTPWWKQMAIFITEDDAQGGVDHVDSHRTLLLVASPYARKNYVSHRNSSFPGLLKTVFRLLDIPPLNLFDATAADLADCFTTEPDFTPYRARAVDSALFDAGQVRIPKNPAPSIPMDDPAELRRQHQ